MKVALICQTVQELEEIQWRLPDANLGALIPFEAATAAIRSETLMNSSRNGDRFLVEIDLTDATQAEFCRYLSVFPAVRPLADLSATVSHLTRLLSDFSDRNFHILCEDFYEWLQIATLCGHPQNLWCIPIIPTGFPPPIQWLSVRSAAVVLPPDYALACFDDDNPAGGFVRVLLELANVMLLPANFARLDAIVELFQPVAQNPLAGHLQPPMRTLDVNLSSGCYEMFETDDRKYDLYEEAMRCAFAARGSDPELTVAVVGAGRGPLVDRALRAGFQHIFVVEKNRNVLILLRKRRVEDWPEGVVLIEGDMRHVSLPRRVDIIVSELLGGFGDNELSPECLAGCDRILSDGAISIPQRYASVIVPIMSDRIWASAVHQERLQQMSVVSLTPTVSLAEPQQVFEFVHPGANQLYGRKILTFAATDEGIMHGFGGWFTSVLFADVVMDARTPDGFRGLNSWENVFFPISRPMKIRRGDKIVAVFERKANATAVWYEWWVIEPEMSPVENVAGKVFCFSLSVST
jgi:protein arginine N-methyltransferase 5